MFRGYRSTLQRGRLRAHRAHHWIKTTANGPPSEALKIWLSRVILWCPGGPQMVAFGSLVGGLTSVTCWWLSGDCSTCPGLLPFLCDRPACAVETLGMTQKPARGLPLSCRTHASDQPTTGGPTRAPFTQKATSIATACASPPMPTAKSRAGKWAQQQTAATD